MPLVTVAHPGVPNYLHRERSRPVLERGPGHDQVQFAQPARDIACLTFREAVAATEYHRSEEAGHLVSGRDRIDSRDRGNYRRRGDRFWPPSGFLSASDRQIAAGTMNMMGLITTDAQIVFQGLETTGYLYRLVWDDQAALEQRYCVIAVSLTAAGEVRLQAGGRIRRRTTRS